MTIAEPLDPTDPGPWADRAPNTEPAPPPGDAAMPQHPHERPIVGDLVRVCAALTDRGAVVEPVDPRAPDVVIETRLAEESRRLRALGERS